MRIVVIGIDHTTAPIELREQLACSLRQVPQLLQAARTIAQECVLLSTCNRLELYAVCADADEGRAKAHLLRVLSEQRQVEQTKLEASCYYFTDEQAVSHLFGVASGLYSLVPGEPQIQGQVAEALQVAQGGRFAGPITSALFRAALVTGKRARSETGISRNAASVSHVAVQLARRLLPHFNESCVLLVGSGKMSELAARNLCDNGARRLVIINRTKEHAIELAERYGTVYRSFSELEEALAEADVVISSTTAPHTIITLELMQRVLPQRPGRALLLIDIALPRDVDPLVASLPGIHLYNLDDLQAAVDEGIRLRAQEAERVKAIIAGEVDAFERWLRSLSVVDTISDLRQQAEQVRQQELARAMRQLAPTLSEREAAIVQELTTRMLNKLLHTPTLRLKEAAATGQGHVYAEAMRYLFDLEEKYEADNEDNHRDESQQTGDDPDRVGRRTTAAAVADARNQH
ncbi:MAG TPA: glutamyl-tRNA reductase [Ktedonobacteraceae bacterium]|nr:glutamyl-tRNA reductase [Ktedonobacteraceae bacterium]